MKSPSDYDGLRLRTAVLATVLPAVAVCAFGEATGNPSAQARDDAALHMGRVTANRTEIPAYGKLELTFDVRGPFDNPFDPDQIDVSARITTPSGRKLVMPGFFYQPFERKPDAAPQPAGKAVWKVRFAPTEPGRNTYRVVARCGEAERTSESLTFRCTRRAHPGHIRVSKSNAHYCEFAGGKPYFPIGINLFTWARLGAPYPVDRLDRCEHMMNRLADAGGNFVRLRMDSWWLAIELPADAKTGYEGLGRYHQPTCWIIDQLYELAGRRGLYMMHCIYNANANVNLRPEHRKQKRLAWRMAYDPFLQANGGPCETHADFWSNDKAKRFVRDKLRYVVARWGWHPNVMCWEFHNETSCRDSMIYATTAWHVEMGRYLRSIDPYNRPVTTSLMGDHELAHRIWELPEIDIIQHHFYSSDEMAEQILGLTRAAMGNHRKPFFLGEYGVRPEFRPGNCDYDKIGIHMHNGMWAAMFAGGCGAGAMWYIENYVDKFDIWSQYRGIAEFAASIPWNNSELVRCRVDPPELADPVRIDPAEFIAGMRLPTVSSFPSRQASEQAYAVHPDFTVTPAKTLLPYLFASGPRKQVPTFDLTFRKPGSFVVRVTTSVGDESNKLVVHLDGRKVAEEAFPAGREHNPQSQYIARYKNWRTPYARDVVIPVPTGSHRVRCEAVGKDRLEVVYLVKGDLGTSRTSPLQALGFRTRNAAWLWFRNRTSNWNRAWQDREPVPLPAMKTVVRGLADGQYTIRWFDTWNAQVSSSAKTKSDGGSMHLAIPPVERDIACVLEEE